VGPIADGFINTLKTESPGGSGEGQGERPGAEDDDDDDDDEEAASSTVIALVEVGCCCERETGEDKESLAISTLLEARLRCLQILLGRSRNAGAVDCISNKKRIVSGFFAFSKLTPRKMLWN
jgi:hypothetical protein